MQLMQKPFCRSITLLSALLASSAALALSPVPATLAKGISPTFTTCQQRAQGAIAQAACISAETTRQDQRLNRVYRALQAKLDASGKAALTAAQRAWLQSRDRDAELETYVQDSTQAGNLQGSDAQMRRLSARADQLQQYLDLME